MAGKSLQREFHLLGSIQEDKTEKKGEYNTEHTLIVTINILIVKFL